MSVDGGNASTVTADNEGHWSLAAAIRKRVTARVALLVDHTRPFALEGGIAFAPRRNPNPQRFNRAYRFESLSLNVPYVVRNGGTRGQERYAPNPALLNRQGGEPQYCVRGEAQLGLDRGKAKITVQSADPKSDFPPLAASIA